MPASHSDSAAIVRYQTMLPALCKLHGISMEDDTNPRTDAPLSSQNGGVASASPATSSPAASSVPLPASAPALFARLSSESAGLSAASVSLQRGSFGFNEVVSTPPSALVRFLRTFWGLAPWSLEAVVIISAALGSYVDAAVVALLLVVNSVLGFVQDEKAAREVAALQSSMHIEARVRRDGAWIVLPSRELVPGDLVRLRGGDILTADVLPLSGSHLEIDQSALTGEAMLRPMECGAKNQSQLELLYAGSVLKTGECTAMVVGTAAATMFGETVALVAKSQPKTHAHEVMKQVTFVTLLPLSALVLAAIIRMAAVSDSGDELRRQIPVLLLLLVSALPVALPAMYTVTQSLASSELVSQGVLVARLNATEDAAAMTVLCTDKTGTLTMNQLTVAQVWSSHDAVAAAASSDNQPQGGEPNVGSTGPSSLVRMQTIAVSGGDDTVQSSLSVASAHAPQLDVISSAARCCKAENADPIDAAILLHAAALSKTGVNAATTGSMQPPISPPGPAAFAASSESLHRSLSPCGVSSPCSLVVSDHLLSFLPFDASTRRTESVWHRVTVDAASGEIKASTLFRVCKGAPKTILALAQADAELQEKAHAAVAQQARHAYRSIAVGATNQLALPLSLDSAAILSSLPMLLPQLPWLFLGVIALYDPPRPDSKSVLQKLSSAGVRVIMLTGDSISVAREVSAQVGLGQNGLPPNVSTLTDANRAYLAEQIASHHKREKVAPVVPPLRPLSGAAASDSTDQLSSIRRPKHHFDFNFLHRPEWMKQLHRKRLRSGEPPAVFQTPVAHSVPAAATVAAEPPLQIRIDADREPSHVRFHVDHEEEKHTEGGRTAATSAATSFAPTVTPSAPLAAAAAAAAPAPASVPFDLSVVDGLAELFPSDKHLIVQYLQSCGQIVGMTGDGVNDAPSLKQAEVGCAMRNATDAAKGSASIVFLRDGLSGILPVVFAGRRIHRRIVSWVLNKIAKTVCNGCFTIVAFFIFSQFPVRGIELAIILMLVDFTTISLATDNVRTATQPCRWHVQQLSHTAIVVAINNAAFIIGLLCVSRYGWHQPWEELHTISMLLMYYVGNFTTLIVREYGAWWHSVPSATLSMTIVLEQSILALICMLGISALDVAAIPVHWFFAAWGCVALWQLTVGDRIKSAMIEGSDEQKGDGTTGTRMDKKL